MPLPAPLARKHIHTRSIDCRGYEREDGLWDIEGHLTDAKTFSWWRKDSGAALEPGEFVHDMWIRLTIDLDMMIHDVAVVTDTGPYARCGNIAPNFDALKGKTIRRGWTKALRTAIGGVNGCTHLFELLGRVAVVAYQSTNAARALKRPLLPGEIPYQLGSCHIYTADSVETRERWPQLKLGDST